MKCSIWVTRDFGWVFSSRGDMLIWFVLLGWPLCCIVINGRLALSCSWEVAISCETEIATYLVLVRPLCHLQCYSSLSALCNLKIIFPPNFLHSLNFCFIVTSLVLFSITLKQVCAYCQICPRMIGMIISFLFKPTEGNPGAEGLTLLIVLILLIWFTFYSAVVESGP